MKNEHSDFHKKENSLVKPSSFLKHFKIKQELSLTCTSVPPPANLAWPIRRLVSFYANATTGGTSKNRRKTFCNWIYFIKTCKPAFLLPGEKTGNIFGCLGGVGDGKREKKLLHRPGIEPGPPAWQASILPLNQRCRHNVLCTLVLLCTVWCKGVKKKDIRSR